MVCITLLEGSLLLALSLNDGPRQPVLAKEFLCSYVKPWESVNNGLRYFLPLCTLCLSLGR